MEDSDEHFRRARSGDERAFEALVERYWERLKRMAGGILHDETAGEDIAQEVFLLAAQHMLIDKKELNESWLFTVAYRAAISEQRKRRRRRETTGFDETQVQAAGFALVDRSNPEGDEDLKDPQLVFSAVMAMRLQLDERSEDVFLFCMVKGFGIPVEVLAIVCGLNEATVKMRVLRMKERLRNWLKEDNDGQATEL